MVLVKRQSLHLSHVMLWSWLLCHKLSWSFHPVLFCRKLCNSFQWQQEQADDWASILLTLVLGFCSNLTLPVCIYLSPEMHFKMHLSQWQIHFPLLKELVPNDAVLLVLSTGSLWCITVVPKTLISLSCKNRSAYLTWECYSVGLNLILRHRILPSLRYCLSFSVTSYFVFI